MNIFSKKSKAQDQSGAMNVRRQILNKNSSFLVQEAYKTLRTNVRFFLNGQNCKKFCITSGMAGEGKSITLINLAISFAEAGNKVLVIDCDLRRPAMARLLVEKASPGLSGVLAGMENLDDAIRKDMYPNLDILFSGEVPPNPSELLGSEKMRSLIDAMSEKYDYILVDTPPVNVVSDACVVANLLDGVLLLVRKDRSRKEDVKRSIDSLRLTGAKVLGFVLNGVTVESKSYGYEYKL
jgi:capsular exopolysaccharide synthesis family protein